MMFVTVERDVFGDRHYIRFVSEARSLTIDLEGKINYPFRGGKIRNDDVLQLIDYLKDYVNAIDKG